MKEEKSAGDGDRAIPPLASFRLGFSSNNRFDDVFFPIASIIFFLAPPSPLSLRSLFRPRRILPRERDRCLASRMRINSSSKETVWKIGQRGRKRRRRTRRDDGEKRKEKKRKEKNLDVGKVRSLDRDKRERWGDTVVVLRL